jgi:hypothetical protein
MIVKKTAKILVRTLAGKPSYSQLSAQLKSRYLGLCKVLLAFHLKAYSVILLNGLRMITTTMQYKHRTLGSKLLRYQSDFDVR